MNVPVSEAIINPDSMHPVLEGLQVSTVSADDQSGMICLIRSTDGMVIISDCYGEKVDIYDLRDMSILGNASPRFRDFNSDGTPEILFSGVDAQGRASVTLFDPELNGNLFMKNVTQDFMDDCSGACEIQDSTSTRSATSHQSRRHHPYLPMRDRFAGTYDSLDRWRQRIPALEDLQVRNG